MAKDFITAEKLQWNWQNPDWPFFRYDEEALSPLLAEFDKNNEISLANIILFENAETNEFTISIRGVEALKTSEIEGENYNVTALKESFRVHASIMRRGNREKLNETDAKKGKGISKMMAMLFGDFAEKLSHKMMNSWNHQIVDGEQAGKYRSYTDAMQVKSSVDEHVEFEAPPSSMINKEMDDFIEWYNDTKPDGENPMHPVIRAGLAHLHFVTIHPYDDGNGRIARALSVKAISEHNNEPTIISLSHAISDDKAAYYEALRKATAENDVQAWLNYFCKTTIKAQEITKEKIYFAALKKSYSERTDLNDRQLDAISDLIEARYGGNPDKPKIKNPDKFSVSDYISLSKVSLFEVAKKIDRKPKLIAEQELDYLETAGIIQKVESNGGARYKITMPEILGLSQYIASPNRENIKPNKRKNKTLFAA